MRPDLALQQRLPDKTAAPYLIERRAPAGPFQFNEGSPLDKRGDDTLGKRDTRQEVIHGRFKSKAEREPPAVTISPGFGISA